MGRTTDFIVSGFWRCEGFSGQGWFFFRLDWRISLGPLPQFLVFWGPHSSPMSYRSITLISAFIFTQCSPCIWTSPLALVVKNPRANARDMRCGFSPWVGKIPWRRAWQPTPVFLLENAHGQGSLVGYCPYSCTESDRTEST